MDADNKAIQDNDFNEYYGPDSDHDNINDYVDDAASDDTTTFAADYDFEEDKLASVEFPICMYHRLLKIDETTASSIQQGRQIDSEDTMMIDRFFNGTYIPPACCSVVEQIHCVQDFKIDGSNVTLSKTAVCIVALIRVRLIDRDMIVTCCNSCHTASNLTQYLGIDWSKSPKTEMEWGLFVGCRHAAVVLCKLKESLRITDAYTVESLHLKLLAKIVDLPFEEERIHRGGWNYLSTTVEDEKGTWAIYVTDTCRMLLLSISEGKERHRYHCFLCPRSLSCHHTRSIQEECELEIKTRKSKSRSASKSLEGMMSKRRYPCKTYTTNTS